MTGLSKMKRERTVGMIHAGTSKLNVKNECKFEHLKIDCVELLTLKRKHRQTPSNPRNKIDDDVMTI